MKKFTIVSLLVCGSTLAQAALPPYYQSVREIEKIINEAAVADAVGVGSAIDAIYKSDDNVYSIDFGQCYLDVKVVYLPSPGGTAGPVNFRLEIPAPKVCETNPTPPPTRG